MYLKMFGFDEKPFHITPNPRFIFLSKIHKEAFAHLLYGIQQRVGFMSLAGEIGTGKTTVLRTLLGQLEDAEYRVALIFNPCLSALELLQVIHREFSIEFDSERSNLIDLLDSLNRFLLQQRAEGKTVVLVVDEAQNLDPKVLEQLRLLSNLETETEKLIQMILVGQPELDELLRRKDLRQLRQRLAVSYHLQPMDADDTVRYVQHRARIAGSQDRSLFAPQALTQIYKYTQGTPRLINILCDRALLVAYSRDSQTVSRQDIQLAQRELRQQSKVKRFRFQPALGLLMLVILVAVAVKLFSVSNSATKISDEESPAAVVGQQSTPNITINEPVAVEETISSARVAELMGMIEALTVEASGQQAVMAIAEAWRQPLPLSLPAINGRHKMKQVLELVGFKLAVIQGSVADLLQLDAPVVLEITLPNVVGKRFLTLHQLRDGQILTTPALTESGWLNIAELKQVWFGKAILPYLNHLSIPLIDQPEETGKNVTAVQTLLTRLPDTELIISNSYDRQTVEAVTQFQRRMQLAPDGRVGAHTLYWLYRQTGYEMPRLSAEDGS